MKRWFVRIVITLAVLFVLIQLIPAGRTNPPVTKPLQAPPEVQAILQRSCYDCHSNESKWPWYAYVAPVSWLVVHDVDEGRSKLNLSKWGDYDPRKLAGKADEMAEQVEEGEMPMPKYLLMHSDAKLSPADKAVIRKWADSVE
jgi:hypothetical protein